jgi:hypothetical protein
VPDPSWEWAWPEWRINLDQHMDEDGWEYSFMFKGKFSWHKPKWWNSFVRRRAWTRKRVKKVRKDVGYVANDPHMLNPEYFIIQSASNIRSPSRASSRVNSRASSHVNSRASSRVNSRASMSLSLSLSQPPDEEIEKPYIEDMEGLLQTLRASRIDREKIEAVDNFLEHGEDELVHLQEEMHEIMSRFVFQASRRALLTRLNEVYRETMRLRKQEDTPRLKHRAEYLSAAIKHADEEVRRLEYWSDVKAMKETESMGAVAGRQDRGGPAGPDPQSPKEEHLEVPVINLNVGVAR